MANRGDVVSVDKLWDVFDREREKELARAAEPKQYSLNVDPATGEIVEDESEVADNA